MKKLEFAKPHFSLVIVREPIDFDLVSDKFK